ncbi:hypothetical protein ACUHMQ_21370, partial [Chitinimonas sp. PSY-7]|uniref:hypothetical protein n=1 Tax=Chitinimonas sp. PSY-7 TaxID=3459088 RepID=UPI00404019BE
PTPLSDHRALRTLTVSGFAGHGLTCLAITSRLPAQPLEVLTNRKPPASSIYPRQALRVYGVRRASMKRWSGS